MKQQDQYPYDSAITGLDNIYHKIGNYCHYINSPCIVTHYRIVHNQKNYLFAILSDPPEINILPVKLLDVRFDSGSVYLKLMGLMTRKTFRVCHIVRPNAANCKWKIYDIDEIQKLINKHSSKKQKEDSLLEFYF